MEIKILHLLQAELGSFICGRSTWQPLLVELKGERMLSIQGQESIISLTGLLARVKVTPRKVEDPLAVAIPF